MKRIVSFTLVLLFAGSAFALENPWDRKLPFKSATVTYKVTGTMSGSKTLYVKDYGRTTAEYSTQTMKMMGMTQEQKEIIITTPEWIYTADLVENSGSKQANINRYMQAEFNRLSGSEKKKVVKNLEAQGVSTIEGLNGTVEKKAVTILGYACDKVTAMGTTAYTISGSEVPLKIQANTMGIKINQEATGVDKGGVPAGKFELPQGIRFENDASVDRMMQQQARAVIQNLAAGRPAMAGAAGQMAQSYGESGDADSGDSDPGDQGQPVDSVQMEQMKKEMQNMFKNMFE